MEAKVSIIMGSTSDLPIMEKAAKVLNDFCIPFELNALSAHRTPQQEMDFARGAYSRGIRVIIAGAGGRRSAFARRSSSVNAAAGNRRTHQGVYFN